ncbi:hypothetical protein F4814DRAFT_460938 [Daldinia grandis]|nr:hypothetical protein F4814DRAFT_460938 [Daldinia grandis]
MSSGTTESIIPNGTEREKLRERFEVRPRPSGGHVPYYGGYGPPYAANIPPNQGYAPPGTPLPYTPPPYPYQPNYTRPAPPTTPDYPSASSHPQPYTSPPRAYHDPRSRPVFPQYTAPPRAPTPPAPPFRSPRIVLTPTSPKPGGPNPFLYLDRHVPGSPFASYPAPPNPGHRRVAPTAPVDLSERPETVSFWTERELSQRMSDIFRPLVGVVGRITREELRLGEQPKVKFDMYPVRADTLTGAPLIAPQSSSRAPMFQITLPMPGATRGHLEDVRNALHDEFATHPNAWHRQAGLVFRIPRRLRAGAYAGAQRSWVPPSCVYRYSRSRQCYVAQYLSPALEDVRKLDAAFVHGDDSDDDQDALVNEMWSDVRRQSYFACYQDPNPSPLKACEARRDHESEPSSGPCNVVETHGWSNFKIPRLCSPCHGKKASLDSRLTKAKALIAELKKQLSESYGQCVLHMDEAGLECEKKKKEKETTPVVLKKAASVESDSVDDTSDETMEKIDPVGEFLRKKKQETYAHLMMISDYNHSDT